MKEFEYLEDGTELPQSVPEEGYPDPAMEAEYEDISDAEYPEDALISYPEEVPSVFPADEDAYSAEFPEEYVDIPEVMEEYHNSDNGELFPEENHLFAHVVTTPHSRSRPCPLRLLCICGII